MLLLSARNLTRQFDAEPVFRGVSLEVRTGERIGLVGPNGIGKSTLLRLLAGLDEPDEGAVGRHNAVETAMLAQTPDFSPDRTLLEQARSGLARLYRLQDEVHELAEKMGQESNPERLERLQTRFDDVQQELERLDGYNVDHRVDAVLSGLGFTQSEYERPLGRLSGGQQSRAMLARLLLQAPDVLLLDEPTNHLDLAALEWLENYLPQCRQAMVLVSHDRYFLDRVTNRTLELLGGRVTDYAGNFSAYRRQKEERDKTLRRRYEKQQEFIAKTEDFIRRHKAGQKHIQAADREKKLERMERIEAPTDVSGPAMTFGEPDRTGDWVIDAVDVARGFGEPLFREFSLQVQRGDRLGIFGANGSGKTTLLRTLIGELQPDRGTVRLGAHVKIGYFDQHLDCLDPESDAVESVRPPDDAEFTAPRCRDLLARFGITGDLAFQKVGRMSGGEQSRVVLARIAARNVNLLALDEPTNHLDLWARDSLEEALQSFSGTVLFVSHDRYFLDRVARRVVVLEPDRPRIFDGNYSDYVAFRRRQREEEQSTRDGGRTASGTKAENDNAKRTDRPEKPRRKRRFPYRKVADLEAEITEKEALLERLEAEMADPEAHRDGDRAREAVERYHATQAELDHLYEHWEEAVELN